MFRRISNSFALAKSSWHVLCMDKKLVLFPVLSGLACLLMLLSSIAPFLVKPDLLDFLKDDNKGQPPPALYVIAFLYYFVTYFVIIFFNAALVSCALIRFHGGTPTVSDGISAAASRLPQILAWTLVSATIGVILKVIENAHEKAGAFISAILGTVWTVITYFVVPVLVVERVGPFAAIKRSVSILKRTWGESLVGQVGIGFFMFLLAIPGILLLLLGILFCVQGLVPVGIAVIILALLYFIGLSAVSSALHGIFLTALYQYAAEGEIPTAFDRDLLEGAFTHKPA